ncbi:hypothetical protein [Cupriavidus sp. BIS7]|uniref:hypothetical protein n=1 Tax=Cupriavidus sp. BIS7 TaxID=1217718 RepID=UPI0012F64BBD|nr:hypothetical protein [Cupriavidus sp. BIS7]
MFRWIRRRWYLLLAAALVGIFIHLSKRGVLYDDDCWSPNHEFFMVRKQTVASALLSRRGDENGWVLIYDKHGNLVHRWDGDLSTEGGPFWSGDAVNILNQPQALLPLPVDGGDSDRIHLCY